jgi:sterol desaturase/sphingolipid hydroxylase (fatty acid hydroxylase superfamily)
MGTQVSLTAKQQQFNAAMARYNSGKGYKLFGIMVSLTNVSLQWVVLYRVWPHDIGPFWQVVAILAAYLVADFGNGLVHMYMDSNDRYDSPDGPLIANFHLHHKVPQYRINSLPVVYFIETGSKVWLSGFLAVVMVLSGITGINPVLLYILAYTGILSSFAEVSHYLCHSSTSTVAIFLGNCGVLLSKRHHAAHHLRDNVNYAFLNGMTDPLLNVIARLFFKGYKLRTDLHYAAYDVMESDGR